MLTNNNISQLHPFAFNGLHALVTLDISYNQLTVAPSIADVKTTLRDLNLSWNYIKFISDNYFHLCRSIIHLELCCNMLKDIPNVRGISRTVSYISLGNNNITNAQPLDGIRFPRLQSLSLTSNQIRSFCFPPLRFVPHLHWISLSSNNLSYIYFSRENISVPESIKISLSNNPWNCNTGMGWIQHCTQKPLETMLCMEWLKIVGMICSSPQELQGRIPTEAGRYSTSQEICCALLCCGYAIVHNEFTWSIYPYSSGLLCWHWGNR